LGGDEDAGEAKLDPTDVGRSLKEHFEETVQAPLTVAMQALLARLDDKGALKS
jgi:hypothetical protein